MMTREDHENMIRRLDRTIQRTRASNKKLGSLVQKIHAKRQLRQLEQERDEYLINFYK